MDRTKERIFFCPVHNASTPCSLQAFGIRFIYLADLFFIASSLLMMTGFSYSTINLTRYVKWISGSELEFFEQGAVLT